MPPRPAVIESPSPIAPSFSPWPLGWAVALSLIFAAGRLLPGNRFFDNPADYLPLHTGLEFLSLSVCAMVFALGWNLRESKDNSHAVFLAAAFLYVGLVDFSHTLSYKGMPDFVTPSDPEKAINFWLAGRLGAALALLGTALLPLRNWGQQRCLTVFAAGFLAAMGVWWIGLYHADWLPRSFITGQGLTPFKIAAEYLLAAVYIAAALILYRRGRTSDNSRWLAAAAWTLALAELFFTLYADVTDVFNLLGHLYKVVADWMIYRALFSAHVQRPFRELLAQEARLEHLVETRTRALKAALEQFRILVEQAPTAIAMFDRDMNYLATSVRWLQEYGDGAKLVGRNHYEAHPDLPDAWKEIHRAALAGAPQEKGEDLWMRADGSPKWVRWSAYPWRDEGGAVGGIIIAAEDITERKQADARFRRLVEANIIGICVADLQGTVIEANDYYLDILGCPREDLSAGRVDWKKLTPPEWLHADEGAVSELLASGVCKPYEKEYIRRDGSRRVVSVALAMLPGAEEQVVALILDITDKRRAEEEIAYLNADLERRIEERTAELTAANRELEGFTFATSHDLRGPLGRINSFSAMLEQQYRDRLEGDGQVFLGFIRQNATRLIQLVDDLLTHARVAQQSLELQPVNLPALAQSILDDLAHEIAEANATIKLDFAPCEVLGDPYALNQALSNLVRNALKYSATAQPPVIEIGGEDIGGRYRVWVRDNGIGFDMVYHDRIFEIFRRLHTYNEYQGNGIGLALTKRAVERMGGKVWAESEPGKGASFFLELQATEA